MHVLTTPYHAVQHQQAQHQKPFRSAVPVATERSHFRMTLGCCCAQFRTASRNTIATITSDEMDECYVQDVVKDITRALTDAKHEFLTIREKQLGGRRNQSRSQSRSRSRGRRRSSDRLDESHRSLSRSLSRVRDFVGGFRSTSRRGRRGSYSIELQDEELACDIDEDVHRIRRTYINGENLLGSRFRDGDELARAKLDEVLDLLDDQIERAFAGKATGALPSDFHATMKVVSEEVANETIVCLEDLQERCLYAKGISTDQASYLDASVADYYPDERLSSASSRPATRDSRASASASASASRQQASKAEEAELSERFERGLRLRSSSRRGRAPSPRYEDMSPSAYRSRSRHASMDPRRQSDGVPAELRVGQRTPASRHKAAHSGSRPRRSPRDSGVLIDGVLLTGDLKSPSPRGRSHSRQPKLAPARKSTQAVGPGSDGSSSMSSSSSSKDDAHKTSRHRKKHRHQKPPRRDSQVVADILQAHAQAAQGPRYTAYTASSPSTTAHQSYGSSSITTTLGLSEPGLSHPAPAWSAYSSLGSSTPSSHSRNSSRVSPHDSPSHSYVSVPMPLRVGRQAPARPAPPTPPFSPRLSKQGNVTPSQTPTSSYVPLSYTAHESRG
ncbi:hypothetical protein KEM52_005650 [Ascosphaera acerosa]|nr:hypothetical protein KEM52_005650 [Ascosphaera acerosa]